MPWSPAQHRLAEFVAHNPAKARAEGIAMKPTAARKMASEGIKPQALAKALRSK